MTTFSVSRQTPTFETPGSFDKALKRVLEQEVQVIPLTVKTFSSMLIIIPQPMEDLLDIETLG